MCAAWGIHDPKIPSVMTHQYSYFQGLSSVVCGDYPRYGMEQSKSCTFSFKVGYNLFGLKFCTNICRPPIRVTNFSRMLK